MPSELQIRLTEMFSWFHEFCKEHGITYYAIGGTALGAVRHNGFIPWDDDIDVGIPRKDYEKLKELSAEEINGKTKYYVEFPSEKRDFVYPFGKFYDTETTLVENTRYKTKRGIYLDIFPLDGIGNGKEEAIKNFKKIEKVCKLLSTRVCAIRKGRKWYKNAAIVFSRMFIWVNPKKLIDKIDKLSRKTDYDESEYVANIVGNWHEKEIHEKEVLGNPTLCRFENINIFIPEKADEYLTELYGNWRELPPPEKRVTHHDYIYLNLDESYLEK